MARNTPKRMKEKTPKVKHSKGTFKKFIIILVIILIGILVYKYIKTGEWQIVRNSSTPNERTPAIYYSENYGPQRILESDDNIFSSNIEITTDEGCSISIKKDGNDFSKDNITVLIDEGIYEISAKSKSGSKSVTRTLQIDKTPPKVEINRNSSGSYTITFADINDIGRAKVIKIDPSTGKTITEIDLMKDLKPSIEIKEKGTYSLEVIDKYGNLFVGNTEFDIE